MLLYKTFWKFIAQTSSAAILKLASDVCRIFVDYER